MALPFEVSLTYNFRKKKKYYGLGEKSSRDGEGFRPATKSFETGESKKIIL